MLDIYQDYVAPDVPTLADLITGTQWNHRLNIKGVFNVKNFGAVGDGVTDDTEAILNAIAACVAYGGGIVFFPRGIYIAEGDLQVLSDGTNAIFPFPMVAQGTDSPMMTIKFLGELEPPACYTEMPTGCYPPTTGSVIYAKTPASGSYPAVFGNGTTWSNIYVIFENLTIRQQNNPELIGINLQYVGSATVKYVNVDVDCLNPYSIESPTSTNPIGIVMPKTNNNGRANIEHAFITGYYRALDINEHSKVDDIFVQSCNTALGINACGHLISVGKVMLQWCKHYLQYLPQTGLTQASIHIHDLGIEDAANSDWAVMVDHINDSGNAIKGVIDFVHATQSGVGPLGSLTKVGGSNLNVSTLV